MISNNIRNNCGFCWVLLFCFVVVFVCVFFCFLFFVFLFCLFAVVVFLLFLGVFGLFFFFFFFWGGGGGEWVVVKLYIDTRSTSLRV